MEKLLSMKHSYDLADIRQSLLAVRELGPVKSERKGPTGVGHTLEQKLGMTENNFSLPDWGKVEFKARRKNSASMVTLFTLDKKAWKIKPLDAVRKYGSRDKDGRLGLYYTMSSVPNAKGLFLQVEADTISVRHEDDGVIAEWKLDEVAARFMRKIPAVVVVNASSEVRDNVEYFFYAEAQFLHGTSADILRKQIALGNVVLDLRMHEKTKSVRNHGTAFRAHEGNLPHLFQGSELL